MAEDPHRKVVGGTLRQGSDGIYDLVQHLQDLCRVRYTDLKVLETLANNAQDVLNGLRNGTDRSSRHVRRLGHGRQEFRECRSRTQGVRDGVASYGTGILRYREAAELTESD